MSRKRRPRPGHATLSDVAALYGVSHQAVWEWSQRVDFPSPSGFVASVPVFDLSLVDLFVVNGLDSSFRRNGLGGAGA